MGIIKNIFNDPYFTDTNQPQDRAVRRENRMINMWVKEGQTDSEGFPVPTGVKIRKVVRICLGIAIAAVAVVIGIYMIRNFGQLGETGNYFR